jgi:peptidoglycan/xylan/chitin deacetylase (PgdA/CDA1 family)
MPAHWSLCHRRRGSGGAGAAILVAALLAAQAAAGAARAEPSRFDAPVTATSSAATGIPEWTCPTAPGGVRFYAPSVRGKRKTVALTFDDGPGASTAAILAILERERVRATFFNIGDQEGGRAGDVRAEQAAGFLVANHSWSHPDLATLSAGRQAGQLDDTIDEQRALLGTTPCEFRPPYGDYSSRTVELARQRHMSVWLWSVDTEDWKAQGSGSSYWVHRIIRLAESEGGSQSHPVVLMHNQVIAMPATVAALPSVIAFFKAHGYAFVDLLGRTGPPAGCGSATPTRVPGTVLPAGSRLDPGSALSSPGGQYRLVMQRDGNLVLYTVADRPLWAAGTRESGGAYAVLQRDGNLVVYSVRGHRALWSTRTSGHPGAVVTLHIDGNVTVHAGDRRLWASDSANPVLAPREVLRPGWFIRSPESDCRLVMRHDGDLVLYADTDTPLWDTGTREPGSKAVLQADGNLVVRSPSGRALWASGTAGRVGQLLLLGRNATIFLESARGVVGWFR